MTKSQHICGLLKKSLMIDEFLGHAYALLGQINIMRREWERGVKLLKQAVELEPNGADANYFLGLGLSYSGRPEEGLQNLKKAIRLDPIASPYYLNGIAIAYRMIGNYDKAIEYLEKSTRQYPNYLFSHLNLSACSKIDNILSSKTDISAFAPSISFILAVYSLLVFS